MFHSVPKLNDPSLLKTNVAYVNGEWVKARSGKTFEVFGMLSPYPLCKRAITDVLSNMQTRHQVN